MSKTDIASAFRLTAATALALLLSSCAMVENAAHSFGPKATIYDGSGNDLGRHPVPRIERVLDLVDSSIEASRAEGLDNFIRDVNNDQRTLLGSYYVFVYNIQDDRMVAHPANPELIGRRAFEIVDSAGQSLGHIFDASSEKGAWVSYNWTNPVTGEEEEKISWLRTADGHVFGSGLYID